MLQRSAIWMLVNVVGVCVYLRFASALWVLPGEEGLPGGPGDAFYWFLCLVPIVLLFLVGNAIALLLIMRSLKNGGNEIALFVWLAVGALWIGTLGYDQYRSFRVIDPRYASVSSPLAMNSIG